MATKRCLKAMGCVGRSRLVPASVCAKLTQSQTALREHDYVGLASASAPLWKWSRHRSFGQLVKLLREHYERLQHAE